MKKNKETPLKELIEWIAAYSLIAASAQDMKNSVVRDFALRGIGNIYWNDKRLQKKLKPMALAIQDMMKKELHLDD